MLRILHIFGKLNNGGAENGVMNIYRHLNKERFQFDFVTHDTEEGFFEPEIIEMGGKIYRGMPRYRLYNDFSYQKAWEAFFDVHPYSIIQIHTTNSALPILRAAIKKKIHVRISHAHSASEPSLFRRIWVKINKRSIRKKSTDLFAVSDNSSLFTFGIKSHRILNGIDAKQFAYQPNQREKIRQSMHISPDAFVIGHIGRFCYAKNHTFMLKLAHQLFLKHKNAKMVFVGNGELYDQIQQEASELCKQGKIEFWGVRNDIYDVLQAFDAFILPSFYEGMPRSAIEAQASGLPCFLSDVITKETVVIPELVRFLSIKNTDIWVQALSSAIDDIPERKDESDQMIKNGFDINITTRFCEVFYEQMSENNMQS